MPDPMPSMTYRCGLCRFNTNLYSRYEDQLEEKRERAAQVHFELCSGWTEMEEAVR